MGSAPGQVQTPDISVLLKIINSQQQSSQTQQQQPQPAPTQAQPTGLEAIFAKFANNGNNYQQPPQAQMQQPPAPPGYDIQSALAAMNVANPAQPAYVPSLSNQQPNLHSILAGFGQQPPAPMQNYGYSNSYQTDNDRKRQAEFEDQSNEEYGYRKGKRQKGEVSSSQTRIFLK